MNTTTNPLSSHFRTPSLYLSLPSRGEHYPEGTLTLDDNNEVAIYPMTAKDEIALSTPDALFSGSATVQVIESCVPAIKNGYDVPSVDIDAILVAIRIATYGEKLDFNHICPSCSNESAYEIDLRNVLDDYKYVDFTNPHIINNLTFFFKPTLFRELNKFGMRAYEEEKAIQFLESSDIDIDTKKEKMGIYLKSVSLISVDITANFISKIVTEDGSEVTDRDFIFEFVTNCDKKTYEKIESVIDMYRQETASRKLHLKCNHCSHKYETPLEFEATNFFA